MGEWSGGAHGETVAKAWADPRWWRKLPGQPGSSPLPNAANETARCGDRAAHELDALRESAKTELVPVTVEHLEAARRAWRRFRKGNHAAALNFGDCFAYALASTTGEPLLFKGDDFTQTDIDSV